MPWLANGGCDELSVPKTDEHLMLAQQIVLPMYEAAQCVLSPRLQIYQEYGRGAVRE
jgi:hypothetical protein